MRALVLLFTMLVFNELAFTQILKVKEDKNFYGVHLQSTFNAPVFFSFYQLNSDNKGWGFKTGYGRADENGSIIFDGRTSFNFGVTDYNRTAEYFYATPQYIPYALTSKKKVLMIAAGLPMGVSNDRLTKRHINDPIRGTYETYLREQNFYFGFELELSYWANLGKNMALKYGVATGMKLSGDAPFQEVFDNYNFKNAYYPGMYRNAYINFQLGVLFSQVKNNKVN